MNKLIIIIDDSKPILNFMKHEIEKLGFTCLIFSNPINAITIIPTFVLKPNLIIVDWMMFDKLGTDVIDELRNLNVQSKYILFTSMEDDELQKTCFNKKITLIHKNQRDELMEYIKCLV